VAPIVLRRYIWAMAKRPPADSPYQARKNAAHQAWREASQRINEAIRAADVADSSGSKAALDLFDAQAIRALAAFDTWRDSFENLCKQVAKDWHD
jgi:hypothetical protein